MKRFLIFGLMGVLLLALAGPAQAADTQLILATGGTAGTYYPFGGALGRIWNTKIPGMNVTAQTTGASAENVRLINKKEVELALVQSDTLDFAYNAKEAFKEKLTGMQAVAVLDPEIIQVVVAAGSPAKSFADLKGLKMGVGAPGSGTEANFRQLLDVYGMGKEDIKANYLSFSESAEQFKDKHIDAFILSPAKVPANTYKGLTEETKTVAVNAVLIASSQLKEEVVYQLTKALFENQPELAAAHAKGAELSLPAAVKGVSIPFHPGAVKYYKEKKAM
ncbi:MAG: TAXI family TRAP transporter solute-binding subunit [Desulfobacterales bacterium]|nr:TAXI family TRAP transporter solute-binding subunit [Desulfobacterales bacterium]